MAKRGTSQTLLPKKEDQLAQGQLMLAERILGKSVGEIAEAFRMGTETVQRRLALARAEGGALDIARALLLERLVPKALALYDAALDMAPVSKEQVQVATEVLKGSQVLEKQSKSTVTHKMDSDTLEAYRAERMKKSAVDGEVVGLPAGNEEFEDESE